MTVCCERSAIEPLSLIAKPPRAVLAHSTCKAHAPHAISACFSLRIEAQLASSHQHHIPDSACALAHVSIIQAWSEAHLGAGRLTTDNQKVRHEHRDDRSAYLPRLRHMFGSASTPAQNEGAAASEWRKRFSSRLAECNGP